MRTFKKLGGYTTFTGCSAPNGEGGCRATAEVGAGSLGIAATFGEFPFSAVGKKKFDGTDLTTEDRDKAIVCLKYEFMFNTLRRQQWHFIRMNAQSTSSTIVANELVFAQAHGFAVATPVTFGDNGVATVTGLTDGMTYFVLAGTAGEKMKLSATSGGAALTLSGGAVGNLISIQFYKEWTPELCPGTAGTDTNREIAKSDCQAIGNVSSAGAFKNVIIPLGNMVRIVCVSLCASLFLTPCIRLSTLFFFFF